MKFRHYHLTVWLVVFQWVAVGPQWVSVGPSGSPVGPAVGPSGSGGGSQWVSGGSASGSQWVDSSERCFWRSMKLVTFDLVVKCMSE